MKALVVDDTPSIRTKLRRAIEKMGFYDVTEAENGLEALGNVMDGLPHLILLGQDMPRMNGVQFLQAFRALGHKTPVLMIASDASRTAVVTAIRAGANHYLIKPFDAEKLRDSIADTLERAI